MKRWTKSAISFTLVCYLIVSSTASAHAFTPVFSEKNFNSNSNTSMLSCHQTVSSSSASSSPDVNNKLSVCDIFCAAISNIIVADMPMHTLEFFSEPQPTLLSGKVSKLVLPKEPRPPN